MLQSRPTFLEFYSAINATCSYAGYTNLLHCYTRGVWNAAAWVYTSEH